MQNCVPSHLIRDRARSSRPKNENFMRTHDRDRHAFSVKVKLAHGDGEKSGSLHWDIQYKLLLGRNQAYPYSRTVCKPHCKFEETLSPRCVGTYN